VKDIIKEAYYKEEKNTDFQRLQEDDVFIKNFLAFYKHINKEQIVNDIKRIKELYPEKSEEYLSEICINNYAKKSSFWGGISAMPGCIPGLGTILQIGSALADTVNLLKTQAVLITGIANIYGFELSSEETFTDILLILSNNTHLDTVKEGNFRNEIIKGGGARIIKNILAGMSECFCRRSIMRFLPIAGIAAGAGMNYWSTMEIGRKANDFYKRKRYRRGNCYGKN